MAAMDRVKALEAEIRRFVAERDWEQFHSPKNLAMAMIKEAAEIVETFQWLTPAQAKKLTPAQRAHLADELADTFIYLKKIGAHYGIDLIDASFAKMKKNALKYPAARNQGTINKRK